MPAEVRLLSEKSRRDALPSTFYESSPAKNDGQLQKLLYSLLRSAIIPDIKIFRDFSLVFLFCKSSSCSLSECGKLSTLA